MKAKAKKKTKSASKKKKSVSKSTKKSTSTNTEAQRPLIIAHRGYSGKYPENTLLAFREAIYAGADMIEFDVHITKDKKMVVTHDFRLGRTVDGVGYLSDYTLKEIKKMEAGAWMDKSFKGESPPSLDEVLALCKGKIQVNIEIKPKSLGKDETKNIMAQQVLKSIKKYKFMKDCVVSSKDFNVLKCLRDLSSRVKIGILDDHPSRGLRMIETQVLEAYSYHPNFRRLTLEDARKLHSLGLKIYPYTPKTRPDYSLLSAMHVDGFITDHVDRIKEYLQ